MRASMSTSREFREPSRSHHCRVVHVHALPPRQHGGAAAATLRPQVLLPGPLETKLPTSAGKPQGKWVSRARPARGCWPHLLQRLQWWARAIPTLHAGNGAHRWQEEAPRPGLATLPTPASSAPRLPPSPAPTPPVTLLPRSLPTVPIHLRG